MVHGWTLDLLARKPQAISALQESTSKELRLTLGSLPRVVGKLPPRRPVVEDRFLGVGVAKKGTIKPDSAQKKNAVLRKVIFINQSLEALRKAIDVVERSKFAFAKGS